MFADGAPDVYDVPPIMLVMLDDDERDIRGPHSQRKVDSIMRFVPQRRIRWSLQENPGIIRGACWSSEHQILYSVGGTQGTRAGVFGERAMH